MLPRALPKSWQSSCQRRRRRRSVSCCQRGCCPRRDHRRPPRSHPADYPVGDLAFWDLVPAPPWDSLPAPTGDRSSSAPLSLGLAGSPSPPSSGHPRPARDHPPDPTRDRSLSGTPASTVPPETVLYRAPPSRLSPAGDLVLISPDTASTVPLSVLSSPLSHRVPRSLSLSARGCPQPAPVVHPRAAGVPPPRPVAVRPRRPSPGRVWLPGWGFPPCRRLGAPPGARPAVPGGTAGCSARSRPAAHMAVRLPIFLLFRRR